MAFGGATSLGATGSTSNNQSSLQLTLSLAGIAVGELAILVIADDNIGSGADADGNEVASVTDNAAGGSNTWIKAVGWTNNMAAAQGGAHCSIWYTLAVRAVAITTGTITANFTNSTASDATAMTGYKFTIDSGSTVSVEATNRNSVSAGQPGALDATTANVECLRVRGIAGEVGTNISLTKTAAFDAIWANGNSATTGTTGEMCVRAEHAISTGTGLSSNPAWSTVNADLANVYVAFREVFGTKDIHPAKFDAPETFGTTVVTAIPNQNIHPAKYTDPDTFRTVVLTAGPVTLTPAKYTDPDTFRTIVVQAIPNQNIHPATFTDPDTFGRLFAQLPYAGGQITKLGPGGYSIPISIAPALVRVVNETVRVVESVLRAMTQVRMVNETERANESILRVIFSDLVRVINETVRVVEGLVTFRPIVRMINETVRVVEGLVTFRPLVRMINETINLNEVTQPVMTLLRLINEGVQNIEAAIYTQLKALMVNETVRVVEAKLASIAADITKVINETVRLVESKLAVVISEITRVINETVRLNEGKVTQQAIIRMINEVERLNEALLVVRARLQIISESLRINESLLDTRALVRFRDDMVSVIEDVVSFRPIVRLINETQRIGEVIVDIVFHDLYRWINEAIQTSEVIVDVKSIVHMIDEALHIIEQEEPYRWLVKVFDETLDVLEDFSISRELVLLYEEAVTLVEDQIRARHLAKTYVEDVTIVEDEALALELTRTHEEDESVVESMEMSRSLVRDISEALYLPELTNFFLSIPTLVCAAIRLYAVYAAECAIAPTVVITEPLIIGPRLEGGNTAIDPTVDATMLDVVPTLDADPVLLPAVEGTPKIEECC